MVAGTRDSFEMTILMNLTVDFESTAPENAAGWFVNILVIYARYGLYRHTGELSRRADARSRHRLEFE